MNDGPEGLIPRAPFALDELTALERVLWGYIQYLQKSATPEHIQRLPVLRRIHEKLAKQLASKDIKEIEVFLDVEELEALLNTLVAFAALLARLFPKGAGRDIAIEQAHALRLRLIAILASEG